MRRDPTEFRQRFNKWKAGKLVYDKGRLITDDEYIAIMENVASENNPKWNEFRRNNGDPELSENEELRRILNDNSYDYRGYYNKYPNSRANADTHWTDEFKTVYHPTFSVQSKYSGKKSLYNPEGVLGGQWLPNGTYVPAWGQQLSVQKLRLPGFQDGKDSIFPVVREKHGDIVNTDLCAQWSNSWLRKNGYITHGNAWDLRGVDPVFNGFEGMKKPAVYNRQEVEKYNLAAADSVFKKFDSSVLDKSLPYAVNMFYNNSPALEDAYNTGNNVSGTHTGILTFNPLKNRWYVTHNIHGTIHQEPFVPLQSSKGKYGVTAIYKPRKKNLLNRVKDLVGFKDGKSYIQYTAE